MIDLLTEDVLSLAQAADQSVLPRRRGGKRPHASTLYRWATVGCRGVKLETIRFGGTLCTSLEALQRFTAALTAADTVARSTGQRNVPQATCRCTPQDVVSERRREREDD